eukprot:2651965-Rhodomonas_salina.4
MKLLRVTREYLRHQVGKTGLLTRAIHSLVAIFVTSAHASKLEEHVPDFDAMVDRTWDSVVCPSSDPLPGCPDNVPHEAIKSKIATTGSPQYVS